MIDIPLDKALVPVEVPYTYCTDCAFIYGCRGIACHAYDRKDGKNVIFKLVDYPASIAGHKFESIGDYKEGVLSRAEIEEFLTKSNLRRRRKNKSGGSL